MSRTLFALLFIAVSALASVPSTVAAQDTPAGFVWENSTEFSFVSTSGNQSSNTFGLKSALEGSDDTSKFKLEFGGVRASSTFTTRTAVGTADAFTVNEERRTEKSAANYYARSRYDHDLGPFYAFGGAGWERNTFAGFDNRYSGVAGLGKAWVDDDTSLFTTDLGVTYTVQKDVVDDPTTDDGFLGLRATIEGRHDLSESTEIATLLIVDENLKETDDLRVDWTASIAVDLTEGLAFKTSYQVQFDNDPALVSVPLFTGGVENGAVFVPTNDVDTFLTIGLVIKL